MNRTMRASWALAAIGMTAGCFSGGSSTTPSLPDASEPGQYYEAGAAGVVDAGTPPADAGLDATVAMEAGADAEAPVDAGADAPVVDAASDAPFCSDGCQATSVSIFADTTGASGNTPCALLTTGQVACWGQPLSGINGTLPAPVPLDGPARALAVGSSELCAVLTSGAVQCVGPNYYGQGGNGGTGPVAGISTGSAVAMGYSFGCALLASGAVDCWGIDSFGMLGAAFDAGSSPVPIQVAGISGATAISAGSVHACALLGDGTVSCWGGGGGDQLDNLTNSNPTPVPIGGVAGARAIASGGYETCVIEGDGGVLCWGDDQANDLGNTSAFLYPEQPFAVQGLAGPATAISVGASHACAVLSTGGGTVACWGADNHGELGNGVADASAPASTVPGLDGVVKVAIGSSTTCAVLVDGGVSCWGSDEYGQLGAEADAGVSLTPVPLAW